MAASKLAKFAFILYTCAAGTLFIEVLQSFTSPDNLGSLVVVSTALASWFELWAVFLVYIYMAIFTLKAFLHVSTRILFHFRPALREKVKERLRKQREAQKLKEEAEQKPSTFTRFFYCIFWPLMIVNGSIFLREEGTPLVQGALQRFITVAETNFFIYVIELMAFVTVFCLGGIIVAICRACRSRTVEASTAIEEGRPEEVSEVKGGIYSTAANYIQASIIDEKLVDLDEPMPKLVDIDEPAFIAKVEEIDRMCKAVESPPVELL